MATVRVEYFGVGNSGDALTTGNSSYDVIQGSSDLENGLQPKLTDSWAFRGTKSAEFQSTTTHQSWGYYVISPAGPYYIRRVFRFPDGVPAGTRTILQARSSSDSGRWSVSVLSNGAVRFNARQAGTDTVIGTSAAGLINGAAPTFRVEVGFSIFDPNKFIHLRVFTDPESTGTPSYETSAVWNETSNVGRIKEGVIGSVSQRVLVDGCVDDDSTWPSDAPYVPPTTYDIERDGVVVLANQATTAFTDTGLTPNTAYTYRIKNNSTGLWSAPVVMTTQATKPAPPAGVVWTGDGNTGFIPPYSGGSFGGGRSHSDNQFEVVHTANNTSALNNNIISAGFDYTRTRNSRSYRSIKLIMAGTATTGTTEGSRRAYFRSNHRPAPTADGNDNDWWAGMSFWMGSGFNMADFGTSSTNYLNFLGLRHTSVDEPSCYLSVASNGMVRAYRANRTGEPTDWADGLGISPVDVGGPILLNAWNDIVWHIKISTTSTNALRQTWVNGVRDPAADQTIATAGGPSELRWGMGLYMGGSYIADRHFWFDNVRVGTSYVAVDPTQIT